MSILGVGKSRVKKQLLPDWFERHMWLYYLVETGQAVRVDPALIPFVQFGEDTILKPGRRVVRDGSFWVDGQHLRLIGWFNGPIVQAVPEKAVS